MTLVSCKHDYSLQEATRLITGPNYMFLTIYSECPRDVQISTMALRQQSKGCTLLISDGFDQLVSGDL